MKCFRKSTAILCIGAFVLVSFVFKSGECKTVESNSIPLSSGKVEKPKENVLMSVAKSLASQALSEFQESARRNPRLGFNITMLLPGIFGNITAMNRTGLADTTAQLGIVGLKGGILGLKAAAVQGVVLLLFAVFLLTGIAYFFCNIGIISCTNFGGGGGGGLLNSLDGLDPFSRRGYDYQQKLHRSTSAVYSAIDDGQKKYT